MAKHDYRLVINHLSQSQRTEDLKFALAARQWIDQFPLLGMARERIDERINALQGNPDQAQSTSPQGNPSTKTERTR